MKTYGSQHLWNKGVKIQISRQFMFNKQHCSWVYLFHIFQERFLGSDDNVPLCHWLWSGCLNLNALELWRWVRIHLELLLTLSSWWIVLCGHHPQCARCWRFDNGFGGLHLHIGPIVTAVTQTAAQHISQCGFRFVHLHLIRCTIVGGLLLLKLTLVSTYILIQSLCFPLLIHWYEIRKNSKSVRLTPLLRIYCRHMYP